MASSSLHTTLSADPKVVLLSHHQNRFQLPAWLEIAKPRLIPLLLATTVGGMALSEGWPISSPRLACTLGGGILASAAAGILNCLWEQNLDGRMQRTSSRALPSGRLSPFAAFIGAICCTLAAAVLLVSGVNSLAAGLSLFGLCSYVLLYTALLKPRTHQNIVVGGIAGAIPPLVGAAAASGYIGLGGWWLFTLVMLWTPAHFWALALLLRDDYRAAGIPMLPVVKGTVVTARAIQRYGWATILVSSFGTLALPEGGFFYGLLFLPFNGRLLQAVQTLTEAPDNPKCARAVFRWSILYLFGICLLLVLSRTQQAGILDSQIQILLLSLVKPTTVI
ncbi:protoheme IX farnesyltransferase [cyanobiont of Ornithocercus magnificus]|nr:protoheme IX farnesyltransferase [cyanobiont of Ornithocercus magnificus]